MSYLDSADVQGWLKDSKYTVSTVDATHEDLASNTVLGKLSQRYDTSGWIDESTTPTLVLSIMTMLVASYVLRESFGESEDDAPYPNWLEMRAMAICDGIVDGSIELAGVAIDSSTSLGGSVVFFPDDAATDLYKDDPTAEGGAPQAFTMGMRF